MTTIAAIYKCPACDKEWGTKEDAEACVSVPYWPLDTKYAINGGWTRGESLYTVHVDPRGEAACNQWIGVNKHPAFGKEETGRCFIASKGHSLGGTMCGLLPLTNELAEEAAEKLEREAERLRRQAAKVAKKAKVYRDILAGKA